MDYNLVAELRAKRNALKLAKDKGLAKIILESDSAEALLLFCSLIMITPHTPQISLIPSIRALLEHNWICRVQHVRRETNICADAFAKAAISMAQQYKLLQE